MTLICRNSTGNDHDGDIQINVAFPTNSLVQ
jgi:hypothetical protein